jgi:putative transposase
MNDQNISEAPSEYVGTQLQLRSDAQYRKRPRLKEFEYTGRYSYHLELTAKNRKGVFLDSAWVSRCVDSLRSAAEMSDFGLVAYCFMPEHLHVLTQGTSDDANLLRFVQRFKQKTAFEYKQDTGLQLWQQSFFDHAMRKDEDLTAAAQYIFDNPVEAGLVEHPLAFSFSGGTYFQLLADSGTELKLRPYVLRNSSLEQASELGVKHD